jgi:hypothetical protein
LKGALQLFGIKCGQRFFRALAIDLQSTGRIDNDVVWAIHGTDRDMTFDAGLVGDVEVRLG